MPVTPETSSGDLPPTVHTRVAQKANFDIKAAKASSDSERWRVSSERKRFLQVHSTIVARRNAAIFDYNAWPKMGGEMPRAPRVQYE